MADLNREAFELSMTWTARHGYKLQDLNNHDYGHLLTYEQYGYLQLGQYSRARQVIDRVRNDYVASGSAPEIASTLANTLAQFVVETGDQDALRELRQIAAQSNAPAPAVTYAIALASATLGDLSPAHQELARLNAKVPAAMLMRDELQALVDSALGNDTGALRALERAAKTDWAQVYTHFGPPVPFKPPHELYGEALLKLRRATDALSVFQQELQIYRGRTAALAGAARAAAAAGDAHLAASYARQVKANLADADRSLTAFDDVLTLARSDPRP
jgi:tetratricopeptide (TPR) repeat protein